MKKVIKINLLAFSIIIGLTACNNNDGSSIPKGDKVMTQGDSSAGSASSPARLSSGVTDNPSSTPTPNADTGASKQNRVGSDTSGAKSNNSKTNKVP